jgi:hypothetical protein
MIFLISLAVLSSFVLNNVSAFYIRETDSNSKLFNRDSVFFDDMKLNHVGSVHDKNGFPSVFTLNVDKLMSIQNRKIKNNTVKFVKIEKDQYYPVRSSDIYTIVDGSAKKHFNKKDKEVIQFTTLIRLDSKLI